MKTVMCRILGVPKLGDDVRLNHTSPTGGRTEACWIVKGHELWREPKHGEDLSKRKVRVVPEDPYNPDSPSVTLVLKDEAELRATTAERLAAVANSSWQGEHFSARVSGEMVILTTGLDGTTFYPMLNGTEAAGRKLIEVEPH